MESAEAHSHAPASWATCRFDDEWMLQAEHSLLGSSHNRLGSGATAAAPNRYALPAAPSAAPATTTGGRAYGGAGAQGMGIRGTSIPVNQGAGSTAAPAYSTPGYHHSSSTHTTLPYSPANNYGAGGNYGHAPTGANYSTGGGNYLSADYTQRHGATTGRSASGRYV
jgi:hypothetical protein